MKYRMVCLICSALLLSSPSLVLAAVQPTVQGVLGMSPVTDQSCAAVWVPVGSSDALAGLTWYNNDGLMVFPEVRVAGGDPNAPVALVDTEVVAEFVSGSSSAWSAVTFNQPVASSRGGFYVLFRFPEGSEQTASGAGGGAGIGYVDEGGFTGWMTADGEQWAKVGRSFGFAIIPAYVPREDWMLEKSAGREDGENEHQAPKVYSTALLPAAPNPFNPATDLRFTLKSAGEVEISIYDVRGHRLVDLVKEAYPAGEHKVRWESRNDRGHRVASGVYFVRFRTQGHESTQRIVLIK